MRTGKRPVSGFYCSSGFTLVEIMAVILVLGILVGIAIPVYMNSQANSRDKRRIADMGNIEAALEAYKFEHGVYPNSDLAGPGGWDTPDTPEASPDFIHVLVTEGYLDKDVIDPGGLANNYKYFRYCPEITNPCPPDNFYVLGVVDMERSGRPHPDSPGWAIASCGMNWHFDADGADWVTGSFE